MWWVGQHIFFNSFNISYLQKYLYDIDISYLAFDSNYLMGFRSRLPTLSIWQPVKLNEEKVWSRKVWRGGRLGGKDGYGNLCMLSSSYHKLALNWSEFFWNANTFIQTKLQDSRQYKYETMNEWVSDQLRHRGKV